MLTVIPTLQNDFTPSKIQESEGEGLRLIGLLKKSTESPNVKEYGNNRPSWSEQNIIHRYQTYRGECDSLMSYVALVIGSNEVLQGMVR